MRVTSLIGASILFFSLTACAQEESKTEVQTSKEQVSAAPEKKKVKSSRKYSPVVVEQQVCKTSIVFNAKPTEKKQTIQLNEKVSLDMTQFLSTHVHKGVSIADNVICQKLNGAQYTGSNEEWIGFIKNAVNGLKNSGGKDMMLKLMADDNDKFYRGSLPHREYYFEGDFGGNKQVIYNLAMLDKPSNTIYTVSVSGAFRSRSIVKEEYQRIIDSIKL